jgi:hypothetical protein
MLCGDCLRGNDANNERHCTNVYRQIKIIPNRKLLLDNNNTLQYEISEQRKNKRVEGCHPKENSGGYPGKLESSLIPF